MLQLRSGWSHEGGTWSCPGGALEHGEDALDGALREASEEVGVPAAPPALLGQYVFDPASSGATRPSSSRSTSRSALPMNFETEAVEWVPVDEVERPRPAPRLRRGLAARPPDRAERP